MKDHIYQFLKLHWDGKSPLLLGLSGGIDSFTLFHVLLEENRLPLQIDIAHIDHGWRTKSHAEAMQLKALSEANNLTFHLKVISLENMTGNLENACRKERLSFFRALSIEFNYQAVLLAHHADDQAETTLKKIFEGSSLTKVYGMEKTSSHDGLTLWRPLLDTPKQTLIQFLKDRQIDAIDDYTNRDTRFLRARLREDLFPTLAKQFGKEIKGALCNLSKESLELHGYLKNKIKPYLSCIENSTMGLLLDLSITYPREQIELRHLISTFCLEGQFPLSRPALESILLLIKNQAADKEIHACGKVLYIDRRRLFLPQRTLEKATETKKLSLGSFVYGAWEGSLRIASTAETPSNWRSAWNGRISAYLPIDEYYLAVVKPNTPFPKTSPISKWWNNEKVPAFLRRALPAVYSGDEQGNLNALSHEFLSGRTPFSFMVEHKVLNLVLIRKD